MTSAFFGTPPIPAAAASPTFCLRLPCPLFVAGVADVLGFTAAALDEPAASDALATEGKLAAPLALHLVFGTEDEEEIRRWVGGRGKLSLLSIVSTVRWKRRKRDSARTRVEGRSIVPESSLTCVH
jgi:hypothetical protein